MNRIFKFIVFSVYLIILYSSLSVYATYDTNTTIAPTSNYDIQSQTDAWIQNNLDYHSSSFTVTYNGDWLRSNYSVVGENIVPSQEYFTDLQPLVDLLYSSGNEYTMLALSDEESIGFSSQTTTSGSELISVEINYTLNFGESIEETNNVKSYAYNKVQELGVLSMNDYDKVRTLNEFVVDNFSYDESLQIYYPHEFITGNRKGVCQAYAGLMYMLLKKAGIESRIIIKDSYADQDGNPTVGDDHAWNLVKVNGNWYHLDVTWNDTGGDTDKYFLKSDSFINDTHSWDTSIYPAAPLNYSPSNPSPSSSKSSSSKTSSSKASSSKVSSSKSSNPASSDILSASSSEVQSSTESDSSSESVAVISDSDTNSESEIENTQPNIVISSIEKWFTKNISKNAKIAPVVNFISKYYFVVFGFLVVIAAVIIYFVKKHNMDKTY